jgi:hypothetical protein
LEPLTHFNYDIAYRPGDENSAADALSRLPVHRPVEPDKAKPRTLFNPDCFIAALTDLLPSLEHNEHAHTITDGQLLQLISEDPLKLDPLTWPSGYELNNETVLALKETGRVWVRTSSLANQHARQSNSQNFTFNGYGHYMDYRYTTIRIVVPSSPLLICAICTRASVYINDSPPHIIRNPRDRSNQTTSGLKRTSLSSLHTDKMTGWTSYIPRVHI